MRGRFGGLLGALAMTAAAGAAEIRVLSGGAVRSPLAEVVEPVGRGEIELGVHQITAILAVPGVKLAGPLPSTLQKWTTYTAVMMPGARSPKVARALVAFLTSGEARAVFATKGFAAP